MKRWNGKKMSHTRTEIDRIRCPIPKCRHRLIRIRTKMRCAVSDSIQLIIVHGSVSTINKRLKRLVKEEN